MYPSGSMTYRSVIGCYPFDCFFSNIELSVKMTGSRTEEGFVKVPLQVELDFGKGYHVRFWHCVSNNYYLVTKFWSLADDYTSHYGGLYIVCTFKKVLPLDKSVLFQQKVIPLPPQLIPLEISVFDEFLLSFKTL